MLPFYFLVSFQHYYVPILTLLFPLSVNPQSFIICIQGRITCKKWYNCKKHKTKFWGFHHCKKKMTGTLSKVGVKSLQGTLSYSFLREKIYSPMSTHKYCIQYCILIVMFLMGNKYLMQQHRNNVTMCKSQVQKGHVLYNSFKWREGHISHCIQKHALLQTQT